MSYEKEKAKLEELGIHEMQVFRLQELTGYYVVDIFRRSAYEVSRRFQNKYGVLDDHKTVPGLYEHILDGTWHKA